MALNVASSLLQQVLSGLGTNVPAVNTSVPVATATSTPPLGMASDVSSLIAMVFSLSALRDWLKLIVIGGFLETCRRVIFSIWRTGVDAFWITAHFDENDSSYNWIMFWLSRQPSWKTAREVQVSTQSFGLNSPAVLLPGEDPTSNQAGSRPLGYLPTISTTYTIWYKWRLMRFQRIQTQTGFYGGTEETLQVCILTRSHSFLNNLLLEAKKAYMAAQENNISVFISDSANNWRLVASRPKRPMKSIVLDPGIKDLLVDDAKDFLESKSWYADRGIPFRRGYLLYGAPGSGKTSIIHSMAGELGLDVYVISLSRAGLDDTALSDIISQLPEKCIALMEDIDAAFHRGLTRETSSDAKPGQEGNNGGEQGGQQRKNPPETSSRVTLSGLLNALDGVGAQEGRLLFATTNKYSALDPALCRPGRMDLHIEFKLASKYQAQELFKCFYLPSIDDSTPTPDATAGVDEESETGSVDSGYNSVADEKPVEPPSPTLSEMDTPLFTGNSHRARAPVLSIAQVTVLAGKFSDAIPEREFSMASLQGYLMSYKTRPFDAVREASKWVEKERADRIEKQKAGPASSATATLAEGETEKKAEVITKEEVKPAS